MKPRSSSARSPAPLTCEQPLFGNQRALISSFDLCPVNSLPTFGDLSKVFNIHPKSSFSYPTATILLNVEVT